MLFKYFSFKGVNYRRYIDVLQDIAKHYNDTKHRTTKMAPSQVTPKDTFKVYNNIRNDFGKPKIENHYLYVNNYVRIIKKKLPLEHKYTEKWSREVFQIAKVIEKKPYKLYKLKDLQGTEISGKFYFDHYPQEKTYQNI